MRQLICGYYQRPKDLSCLKCLFSFSPPLNSSVVTNSTSWLLCLCAPHMWYVKATMVLRAGWRVPVSSPCLQEADRVPGPDLCPAAARSRLPVDPAERKSHSHTNKSLDANSKLRPHAASTVLIRCETQLSPTACAQPQHVYPNIWFKT